MHLILILLNFSIILLPYYYPRRYESYITDKLYENVDNKWVYNSNVVNKKFFINETAIREKIEENKSKPKKRSRFQQRLEEMQRTQQQKMKSRK